MVTTVITSYGTLGDTLPLIALGKSLQARGQRVRMAISEPMHPYALKAGLEVASNGRPALGQQEAQQHSQSWDHLSSRKAFSDEAICESLWINLVESLPHILAVCQNADLLISTPQQDVIAAIAHEKLGIPWISVSVTPSLHCQERTESQLLPTDQVTAATTKSSLSEQVYELIQKLRRQAGVVETPPSHCERFILAASHHFSQPVAEYSHTIQTGFWFYEDPEWEHWQPDRELRAFVEQEPKPLVLSFSSQPLADSQSVVETHVRAAAQLGRRLLIQQGWADFNERHLPPECDRDRIMFAGFMPQDWLFSRAAALIHHGGVGTIARALRNGCPMLVEPYGNDQFFNARQILLLGVGAAMHPRHLSVGELVRVLQEKVLTPDYKNRTELLSHKIQAEQGLDVACNLIEGWL
jgi:UDP:flavonoid glycosyltransferase YjiC (YdhE family)